MSVTATSPFDNPHVELDGVKVNAGPGMSITVALCATVQPVPLVTVTV